MATAAAQKIIDRANAMPRGAALSFLKQNIEHHQDLCAKIINRAAKPAGWSLGVHQELIQDLISAESHRRAERIAA